MKKVILIMGDVVAAALVISCLLIWWSSSHTTKKPAPAAELQQITTPCSANADPCIEIQLQGGETYKLNDFRFVPTNCIDFISLPDRTSHSYCGLYQMRWIGPENMPHGDNI